jgi:hypothetical protein
MHLAERHDVLLKATKCHHPETPLDERDALQENVIGARESSLFVQPWYPGTFGVFVVLIVSVHQSVES